MLAQAAPASICDRYAVDLRRSPSVLLPAALAARYPDGVIVRMEPSVDGAGSLTKVVVETKDAALASFVRRWARQAAWTSRGTCTSGASGLLDVEFFPPWTGARSSSTFAGANFGALRYGRGPCEGSDASEFTPQVERVYGGKVAGEYVAVVQLRCEFPIGFNDEVRVYRVVGGRAIFLRNAGSFAYPAPDDPYVEHGWLHVRFARNVLYLDEWQYFKRCARDADWFETSWTVRNNGLVKLSGRAHHRASVATACD